MARRAQVIFSNQAVGQISNVNRSESAKAKGLALAGNEKDMVDVFLRRLPPCGGAGEALLGKRREVFRQLILFVARADALASQRTVFHQHGYAQVVHSAAFVAGNEHPILGLGILRRHLG